jgi:hypothetical protein
MVNIDLEIKDLYFKAFAKKMAEDQKDRKKGIHVSALSYGCSRKLFYEFKDDKVWNEEDYYNKYSEDQKAMYKMSIGTAMHVIPLTVEHEVPLSEVVKRGNNEYLVTGSIDEVFTDSEGGKWIVDKKYVGYVPKYEMQAHHRLQVGFYASLYAANYKIVPKGIILAYFDVPSVYNKDEAPVATYFCEELTQNDVKLFKGLKDKLVEDAVEGLESNIEPIRRTSWYCRYCNYKDTCFSGLSNEEQKAIIDNNRGDIPVAGQ